ncbi:hypothetical protein VB773_05315 [Haloarculaceae archaeon H-GB2-1]|nr:hypothetical protein [Haloarculaceae archaeon H-GB1-1]MEA5388995.1 hypothetical protein [Haloarculaceae archaeon H-GB11]MEA5407054.1 hypothetical protein [Haloarculaceae archaeon H-GB2-1]
MRRRDVLTAGSALLLAPLAGCVHSNAVLTMDEVTDAEIARRASSSGDDAEGEYGRIVREAIENGSATVSDQWVPFEPDRPVAYEGSYYQLSYEVTDSTTRNAYDVSVDFDPPSTDGPTVAFADLPEVDRAVLSEMLPPREDAPENEGPDMGVVETYSPAEEEASELVPTTEYEYVSYEGTSYGITVEESRQVTVNDYRYTAERVAGSADEFGRQLRAEFLFTLSGLSRSEQDLVEKAIEEGYYGGSGSDAFRSLVEKFRPHEPVTGTVEEGGSIEANYLVRYEGTVYWTDVYYLG